MFDHFDKIFVIFLYYVISLGLPISLLIFIFNLFLSIGRVLPAILFLVQVSALGRIGFAKNGLGVYDSNGMFLYTAYSFPPLMIYLMIFLINYFREKKDA